MNKANIPKNYKTRPCKRFHEELYCPYGPRCQFKHMDEDVVKANLVKEKEVAAPSVDKETLQ